MKRYKTKLDLV